MSGGSSGINGSGVGGLGKTSGALNLCSHCKTRIYGGRKAACPWKDLSVIEARRIAKQALIRLENSDMVAAAVAASTSE